MSKDQELKYLREKVKKLQGEAEEFQAGERVARPAPGETEVSEKESEEDTKLAEEVPTKASPPQRDESIPSPEMRKKESLKEVHARLAKELKNKPLPKEKVTGSAVPSGVKDREVEVDSLLKKK